MHTLPEAAQWISPSRFEPYLNACANDYHTALDVYAWNSGLASALFASIGHFEISLRNAYNHCMDAYWSGNGSWLLDPNSPVNAPLLRSFGAGTRQDVNTVNRASITEARKRSSDASNPNDIVANLSFGFWSNMTDRAHERVLWIPALHRVFLPKSKRSTIHACISAIGKMRNRIAHHKKLFGISNPLMRPTVIHDNINALLLEIGAEVGMCVYQNGQSPFETFLQQHPCPIPALLY